MKTSPKFMIARHSPWQSAVPRIERTHRHWLTDTSSLTQKLKAHSGQFSVIRIHQKHAPLQQSEHLNLQLPRARKILQRQVLLLCEDVPVVFAHTVTDFSRVTQDWHFFDALGNRSLGTTLFANPLIHRLTFEYTRLARHDFLYLSALAALHQAGFDVELPTYLWARRSVFTHHHRPNSRMMVTEVMLPAVYLLTPV